MKRIYIALLSVFLFPFYFSCMQKKEMIEQKDGLILKEDIRRSRLYVFFDTIIKVFPTEETREEKNYYFIFKETNLNDTIFQFSYCSLGFPDIKELGYKGFLKKDSIKIAIYDEENVALNLYKDSLQMKTFPNEKNILKKREHLIPHMIVIGAFRSNKLEMASAAEITKKGWSKYFK